MMVGADEAWLKFHGGWRGIEKKEGHILSLFGGMTVIGTNVQTHFPHLLFV